MTILVILEARLNEPKNPGREGVSTPPQMLQSADFQHDNVGGAVHGDDEEGEEVVSTDRLLFSKRFGLVASPAGLISDNVPDTARAGLCYLIEEMGEHAYFYSLASLQRNVFKELRISPPRHKDHLASVEEHLNNFENFIMKCNWARFYDTCELIHRFIGRKSYQEKFTNKLNALFRDEALGFELRDGRIEKIGTGFIDAQIKEARVLLKEPEFKGADKQFEKAIRALNIRPEPDVENCVKDAVSALESVARIISGNKKALLSSIVKDMAQKGIIPKPLDEAIQKIYAYRGNEPGVAHGLVGVSKVTVDEAEFLLAMSAAAIIYLVKKRSNVHQTL